MGLKKFLIFSLCFFGSLILGAQDEAEKFERANNAYVEGNFEQSEDLYRQLLEAGYDSADLYYNLGNTYYRLDQIPLAILYYEKALKKRPLHKDYKYNLSVAKSKIEQPLEEVPEFFLDNWWRIMASWLPSTIWGILGLVFLWAGVAGGVFWLLGRERVHRKRGFVLGIIALAFCILPLLLANSRLQMSKQENTGIVMQHGIGLKSAPESDQEISSVPGGTKIKLIDAIGNWYKVELPNGETGWLPAVVFEKI
jgi:tetratricopeptide (TPR) repeat protein